MILLSQDRRHFTPTTIRSTLPLPLDSIIKYRGENSSRSHFSSPSLFINITERNRGKVSRLLHLSVNRFYPVLMPRDSTATNEKKGEYRSQHDSNTWCSPNDRSSLTRRIFREALYQLLTASWKVLKFPSHDRLAFAKHIINFEGW